MSQIDASIPLGIKPVQIESPLNQLGQVLSVQSAQNQNALAQYGLARAQRQDDETNKLAQLMSGGGVDLSTPEGQAKAYGVAPTQAAGYIKGMLENKNIQAQTGQRTAQGDKDRVEAENKTISVYRDASQSITDPQSAIDFVTHMHSDPRLANSPIAQVPLEKAIAQIPQDPAQLGAWKQQFALGATKFMELNKPTTNVVNTGGKTQMVQTPGLGGAPVVAQTFQNTQSPDNAATNATSRANNAANINKDFVIAGVNPDGTAVDGGGLLSQESIINAATRYNMDGTLPPNLGRGTQGPRQTAQILNEAARQAAARGDSPEAQRIAQLANKANAQAMGTIEKQATMVGAFEKNFTKNADIALELSQKVDRTGVPILNRWINAGRRSVTGDADLAAFDANIKATVNEYAKIVGGGSGSGATAQGEIAKIEGLLSSAQTPQQVASVISLMKRETANRLQAFEEQKAQLRSSMIQPGSAKPAPAATGGPSKIGSDAEYKALPSGAEFIAPDGSHRRKP